MEMPGIGQRLCRGRDPVADQFGKFVERGRRLVGDVDDPPVHRTVQGELHRAEDVTVMDRAQPVGGMPPCLDRMGGKGFQVSIPVPVDEWKAKDRPVEAAAPQFPLGGELARRVGVARFGGIVLPAGA